ncbi:MAG: 23S rRNA (pseudouridine(1915)-N(3))-methyltransferase RlmH [Filifactoraceae bacterium]
MNIRLITVGKLKEDYLRAAQKEYEKRLNRFIKLEILELPEAKLKENPSEKEEEKARELEGQSILAKIKSTDTVIVLDLDGKSLNSVELSKLIDGYGLEGKSSLVFIIGGSTGLSPQVKSRGDFKLAFSKLTFPHQLFRIMVLEQIYRAFKIKNNEAYHK